MVLATENYEIKGNFAKHSIWFLTQFKSNNSNEHPTGD